MASQKETGHAINIAHFQDLISSISGFSSVYSPSNILIVLTNMQNQYTTVDSQEKALNTAIETAEGPVHSRQDKFAALNKTVSKVNNSYGSTNASKRDKSRVQKLTANIRGDNAKRIRLSNGKLDPKFISRSHLSFVNKLNNLDLLINFLELDPLYSPNESGMKIATLKALKTELTALNKNVSLLANDVVTKRIARNFGLYLLGTGLIDVALLSKKYIRSVFGSRSPEAKEVGRIAFRRLMKLKMEM